MEKVTIYIKETCSKSQAAVEAFREAEIDVCVVDYYKEALSPEKLLDLVEKSGGPLSDFIRTKEEAYKELGLEEKNLPDKEFVEIVVTHPDLLERPFIEIGGTVLIARTPEKLEEAIRIARDFEKRKSEWKRRQEWHGGKRS